MSASRFKTLAWSRIAAAGRPGPWARRCRRPRSTPGVNVGRSTSRFRTLARLRGFAVMGMGLADVAGPARRRARARMVSASASRFKTLARSWGDSRS